MSKYYFSEWKPVDKLLITRLSGELNKEDIVAWEKSLSDAAKKIPANSEFKLLINLFGFKAANFEVHKEFRNIIPLFLAEYGYRIGYLDMFPEATIKLKNNRSIQCVAMANVHQDETKMKDYQVKFSNAHEQYFVDDKEALMWIQKLEI